MILLVEERLVLRHLEQQADRSHDVGEVEDRLLQRHPQLPVHLESADLGELVACRVEVEILEVLSHLGRRRSIGRSETSVDGAERLLLRRRLVFLQGLLDVSVHQADGFELRRREREEMLLLQRLTGQQNRFVGLLREDLVDGQAADVGLEPLRRHRRDLEREVPSDPILVEPERLQKRGDADLPLSVQVRAEGHPPRVEEDLQPSTELGENVALILMDVLLGEVHSGGAGQLVHQSVLGTVDDERAATRHHREVADVQFRVLQELPFLKEACGHAERAREGEVLVLALQLGVPRISEIGLDELQDQAVLAVTLDWRDVREGA